ncbi:mono-functional DNA-alkylating methyl methanesulfonate N-term-domain-containing protein [Echria macrotheca]|uniref:Mono-functional DNA-alkylating methyl methanesulfonate N-term-domain-containing protein n=1 Tax=Echria macrotheca TaxID=438768 RepID=A0AAJ0BH54_9PEZI|nr:mono-functional DNA-alkylating methyl methanesulfonate N-term-domain-containing protein [Echria macrotheca]
MSFYTNVFRGGQWTTETVDIKDIVKANSGSQEPKKQRSPNKAPQLGLLTRTVVESHALNFILPVRLRSPQHNDVAFIGDHDVRIQELGSDGRLREIARKSDFGSRIRNACVVGTFDIREDADGDGGTAQSLKMEDVDPEAGLTDTPNVQFPPQMLLLVMECGDSIFLFLRRGSDGCLEFVASCCPSPRKQLVYPGFHLAIDPSSRYVALACAQDFFVVYELESMENLGQAYAINDSLKPVRSIRPRTVRGVIYQIQFLYPRPGDDRHIILLLIIVRNNRSSMVTYEWNTGDDLSMVLAEEKRGHRMPVENQMPILIIPLTVKSAFIAISPEQVSVCTETLHGPPYFEAVEMQDKPPTRNHHGRGPPLWTAWARPFRLSPYFKTRDCIYLAREDGVVIFIEADSESALDRSTFMDTFDSNISKAFTCLFDQYTDVLMLGSESGPGAIWKVPARQPLELLGTLPNWSPTVDFATTDEFSTWNQPSSSLGNPMKPWGEGKIRKPDRVFATSGNGAKGSITEYRYGLKAEIALDLDYGTEFKQAWLFPAEHLGNNAEHHVVLSMATCSALLLIPEDFSQVQEAKAADATAYDLSAPTLAMEYSDDGLIQVTKEWVVVTGPDKNTRRFRYRDIISSDGEIVVSDAAILDGRVAVSAYSGTDFHIHTFIITPGQDAPTYCGSVSVDGDVTSLSLAPDYTVLAGIWKDGQVFLAKTLLQTVGHCRPQDVQNISQAVLEVAPPSTNGDTGIGAIASIISAWGFVLLGTRSGEVIRMSGTSIIECEKFGVTAAHITCSRMGHTLEPVVLVSCDRNLIHLRRRRACHALFDSTRSNDRWQVWPVDASNLAALPPPVEYGIAVNLSPEKDYVTPVLVVSGTKVLIVEMQHQPGPVNRQLPVGGTPTKVIYSEHLQCLVAAVHREGKPTLAFLDPETGEDLGRPLDKKTNKEVEFISGLGKAGDRIFGLGEWKFVKGSTTWRYILVNTKGGRMIVVSTSKEARDRGPPLIRYWMQFQKKGFDRPVYSAIGFESGLIYCVGQTVYWDAMDLTEKRLVTFKKHELGSPATSLRLSNGKLMALTTRDSLEVIDSYTGPDDAQSAGTQSHIDPQTRNAIHMIEVAGTQPDDPWGSIVLVADRECGVGGLWVPYKTPGRECEVVFSAELPRSIRRFRRGRTRPIWEQAQHKPMYGRLASTLDDAEILGISLDGSMQHFTLLNVDIWRLLRFIQNIALTNEEINPFTHEPVDDYSRYSVEPRKEAREMLMHVDGDMLLRCLERRALERLLSWADHEKRFVELLDGVENGEYTAGLSRREEYYGLAYNILDYFLRPVL